MYSWISAIKESDIKMKQRNKIAVHKLLKERKLRGFSRSEVNKI